MNKNLLITLTLLGSMNALGCSFTSPSSINIGVSLENQNFFSYSDKTTNETIPNAEIKNCSITAAKEKYVMVTFGPEVVETVDAYRGINFNKVYKETSNCSFKNNPLEKITTFDERQKKFDGKWKLINKCVQVIVKEMGARPLSYPKNQEGCVVTPLSSSSASFNGGYCFFKPFVDSYYSIMVKVSKECLTLNGFKDSGIDLQDINTELSAYTTLTYKDDLEDLVTLGTSAVRLSVNPDKSILKPSDDFGMLRPTFPENYQVNDLHLGKLLLKEISNNRININVPFLVDNAKCAETLINGVQSSACDYATPFVGSISLKDELGKDILTWQDGGVATSNWQGIISGEGYQINKDLIPTNKNYTLEIEFGDPQFSFSSFRNKVINRIGHLSPGFLVFSKDGTISEVNDIRKINQIENMITVDPINGLRFENPMLNLANNRRRLASYFSTSMFPPSYEKTCNSNGKCLEASKTFVKFFATFKLLADYSLANLKITRQSELLGSYTKTNNQQPEYVCE